MSADESVGEYGLSAVCQGSHIAAPVRTTKGDEQVSDDLNGLAEAGAETLIRLLATDTWEGVKQLAGRLVANRDRQLAASKQALTQNPGDADLVGREVAGWRTRLQDAVDNDESLHRDLQRFVDEHREPASPISQRQRTGNRSVAMQASATGNSKVNQVHADGAKKVVVDSPRTTKFTVPVIGPALEQAIQHKVIAAVVAVAVSGGLAFGVQAAVSGHGASAKSAAQSARPAAPLAAVTSNPVAASASTPAATGNSLLATLKARPTKFMPSESAFEPNDLKAISGLILSPADIQTLFGENLAPIAPSSPAIDDNNTYEAIQDLNEPDCTATSMTERHPATAQIDGANSAAGDVSKFLDGGPGTMSAPAKYYREVIMVTPNANEAHDTVDFSRALVECGYNFAFQGKSGSMGPYVNSQIVENDAAQNEFIEGYEMAPGSTDNPYILQASVGRYVVTIDFYGADPAAVFHTVQGHLNRTAAQLGN